jgi:hypothetical protein
MMRRQNAPRYQVITWRKKESPLTEKWKIRARLSMK